MKRLLIAAGLLAMPVSGALAGPWEDGMAAYNRGDYVPTLQLVRPLAQQGNAKAQGLIGTMYRRGQGVAKSSKRAFMWLSLAAARGDTKARTELHEVSQSMTQEELVQAQEMMQACEASNYRSCEY